MPTDRDLRKLHIVDNLSYKDIADMTNLSKDSIRGRISRSDISDRVDIARELAGKFTAVNTGVERQKEIIKHANETFESKQKSLRQRGTMATAMFISDMHLPNVNWDALKLTALIMRDVQPDYYSSYNDLFDFTGYGRWGDDRPPAARLWDDDIANPLALSAEIHDMFHRVAPNATPLQVQGNHDNWLFSYLRNNRNGFSERNVADFMSSMELQGVLQFTNGVNKGENIIKLSPGLKWVHGVSASANLKTVANATQAVCAGKERDNEDGIFYNTVSGHTHRAGVVRTNGVTHWNSGTLRTFDPSYMKFEPLWNMAIVINRYDPDSRFVLGDVVYYKYYKSHLVARYDGIDYDIKIEENIEDGLFSRP